MHLWSTLSPHAILHSYEPARPRAKYRGGLWVTPNQHCNRTSSRRLVETLTSGPGPSWVSWLDYDPKETTLSSEGSRISPARSQVVGVTRRTLLKQVGPSRRCELLGTMPSLLHAVRLATSAIEKLKPVWARRKTRSTCVS